VTLEVGLHPVRGELPAAMAVREAGLVGLILPRENVTEAAMVEGVELRGAPTPGEVARFLVGEGELERAAPGRSQLLDFTTS
jgi:magnesium chelatase family protein